MGNSRFDSRRLPRHSVLKVNNRVNPTVLCLFLFKTRIARDECSRVASRATMISIEKNYASETRNERER